MEKYYHKGECKKYFDLNKANIKEKKLYTKEKNIKNNIKC